MQAPRFVQSPVGGRGGPRAPGSSLPPSLPAVTRGDVFTMPEDEYWNYEYSEGTGNSTSSPVQPESVPQQPQTESTSKPTTFLKPEEQTPEPQAGIPEPEVGYQERPDTTDQGTSDFPEEELCSGKPFDAFTDLKNGSIFAFRGASMDKSGGGGVCPRNICFSHSFPYSRAVLL